jgi:ADP-ribosyl-[dinitrogen reductase] hydrolase
MMRTAVRGDDPFERLVDCLESLPADVRTTFANTLEQHWTPQQPAPSNGSVWGCLANAVWAVRSTTTFADALVAAIELGGDTDTVACVTGALAGARYGVQGIPARWTTYVHGHIDTPKGPVEYRLEQLQQMARRLIGIEDRGETTPELAAGPIEVAPSLHAADLVGASGVPTSWAVVSLCRTRDRFNAHPVRRQVYLIDEPDHELNPDLAHAVRDAVDAVEAFLAEGRQVVVHCHGGRSRTGLVLKAWAMRTFGFDERDAHEWLEDRWFRYEDYNNLFVDFLAHDW